MHDRIFRNQPFEIKATIAHVSQAFLYNAVFFTYALILTRFYQVPGERPGLYLFPFALGNYCGPLILGSFFDTIGRRQMIAAPTPFLPCFWP